MDKATLTKTVFFDASRETVWGFLTEKDKLARWYHHADRDLTQGQSYCLHRIAEDGTEVPQVWGEVLDMDPPTKLVCTFRCEAFADADTTVTWLLESVAGGTRLTLRHEGVAEAASQSPLGLLKALDKGWDEHLARLRQQAG